MFENLQGFFESTTGQIITIGIIVIFFILILIPEKNKKPDVKALTISALMIALSVGLGFIKLFDMPYGGSITALSMLPIMLCGYLLGTRKAVMAGICLGLLNLIFGPYVIHPVQLLVDYPLAFGAMGLSGVFRNQKNGLVKGYAFGVFCRYLCAVFSGIVFFGSYAGEGFNAITWSLWYNLIYLGTEGIITVIILMVPPVKKALESLKKQM